MRSVSVNHVLSSIKLYTSATNNSDVVRSRLQWLIFQAESLTDYEPVLVYRFCILLAAKE